MTEDWAAVAKVINDRMKELGLTQQQVASAAEVSMTTLRELQNNTNPRRRRPQTLTAVAVALQLPERHLVQVLSPETEGDPVTLDSLQRELVELRNRVEAVERAQEAR